MDIKYIFNIINDSYVKGPLNDSFIIFKAFNDLLYLIYSSKSSLINCYDLTNFQKICEIKDDISNICKYVNFNHIFDSKNKRDLVLSIYCSCDIIKLWNIYNWQCLIKINSINNGLTTGCCCFLKENNENIYIVTSCRDNKFGSEPIKIFDLKGNKIKDINSSKSVVMYITNFYDNMNNKNYIISCNLNCLKSYDYIKNELYHEYTDKKENELYSHAIIYTNSDNALIIISSSFDGYIRLWNFHTNKLINKIKIKSSILFEICLWNNDYLFVGCGNDELNLINLKNGNINSFHRHKNAVINIKKFYHKNYGQCLITQGKNYDRIIIWIFEEK